MTVTMPSIVSDGAPLDPLGAGHQVFEGALLGHAAVVIWNDVTREGREPFYAWHDREHMPERLAIPGFRRGRRFARPGHSPEWLTIYEADDLSVLTSSAYLARLNAPTPGTVETVRHFQNTSRAVCCVVHSVGAGTGGHMLAMRPDVPSEQSNAMCRTLCVEAFPRVMQLTGVVACHLYAADTAASFVNTKESSNRAIDVPSWVVLCEATGAAAAAKARAQLDIDALRALGVTWRDDAAIYALEICLLSQSRR